MAIPYVSRKQIAKLDQLMVRHFKIPIIMMMEHAGYRMAEFVRKTFPKKRRVLICCGKGNNGGDGIAAARHLLNFGYQPTLFLITNQLKHEPKMHLRIVKTLNIPLITSLKQLQRELNKTDIVYDCLIGYNLKGVPRGKFTNAITSINNVKKPIIACDVPSGVDTDKGITQDSYIRASHILFLSLPKQGCKRLNAKKYVADIGVPKALYPKINVKAGNYFKKQPIVTL